MLAAQALPLVHLQVPAPGLQQCAQSAHENEKALVVTKNSFFAQKDRAIITGHSGVLRQGL